MQIEIIERREYELYVKKSIAKTNLSNKQKGAMRKITMQAFDDGVKFNQGKLIVEILE